MPSLTQRHMKAVRDPPRSAMARVPGSPLVSIAARLTSNVWVGCRLSEPHERARHGLAGGLVRGAPRQEFGITGGNAAHGQRMQMLAIVAAQHPKRCPTQPHRLFQHRVEHRRQIAGRGIDHLQHLSGRGLLLQRLPLLGDQPRVLHRDDRLSGEVFKKRDLLVSERTNLLAVDGEVTEKCIILAQRHCEHGAAHRPDRPKCGAIGSSGPIGLVLHQHLQMCTTGSPWSRRPCALSGPTRCGVRVKNSANAGASASRSAAAWSRSPS